MQNFSIDIPCKTYIKKYYTTVFGDSMQLDHFTDFGDCILTKMATKPLASVSKKLVQLEVQHYEEKLKFKVPMTYLYRINTDVSPDQVYNINRYLENCFEDDMFLFIRIGTFFGVERNTCIRAIADRCNIILGEDISFDSLKKQESRYRKKPTARHFFLLQMSSPFNWNLRA